MCLINVNFLTNYKIMRPWYPTLQPEVDINLACQAVLQREYFRVMSECYKHEQQPHGNLDLCSS